MRVGRLRESTLTSILASIDEEKQYQVNRLLGVADTVLLRSQKQYLPVVADSPLFRLVTVLHLDTGGDGGSRDGDGSDIGTVGGNVSVNGSVSSRRLAERFDSDGSGDGGVFAASLGAPLNDNGDGDAQSRVGSIRDTHARRNIAIGQSLISMDQHIDRDGIVGVNDSRGHVESRRSIGDRATAWQRARREWVDPPSDPSRLRAHHIPWFRTWPLFSPHYTVNVRSYREALLRRSVSWPELFVCDGRWPASHGGRREDGDSLMRRRSLSVGTGLSPNSSRSEASPPFDLRIPETHGPHRSAQPRSQRHAQTSQQISPSQSNSQVSLMPRLPDTFSSAASIVAGSISVPRLPQPPTRSMYTSRQISLVSLGPRQSMTSVQASPTTSVQASPTTVSVTTTTTTAQGASPLDEHILSATPSRVSGTSLQSGVTPTAATPSSSSSITAVETSEAVDTANKTKVSDRKVGWEEEYAHIDTDWGMQAMDALYGASFYEYVRDERNVDLSGLRLARLVREYKPKQVATAIRWMTQGWTIESTSKLLRVMFSDWLPDLAGCVYALVTVGWPQRPQVGLCTAYLLISEPPAVSALFTRTLTSGWDKDQTLDLITYLDNMLEWSEGYFREFVMVYSGLFVNRDVREREMEVAEHGRLGEKEYEVSTRMTLTNSRAGRRAVAMSAADALHEMVNEREQARLARGDEANEREQREMGKCGREALENELAAAAQILAQADARLARAERDLEEMRRRMAGL